MSNILIEKETELTKEEKAMFAYFGEGAKIKPPFRILNPHRIKIGDKTSIREGAYLHAYQDLSGLMNYINPKYKSDFELYIDGKYSKMSNEYKTALLNLYTQFSEIRTDLYHILYPTERERRLLERRLAVRLPEDAEIFSSIEFREEIYDEDNFI